MTRPADRLPPASPVAWPRKIGQRQDGARVVGPHMVVAVFPVPAAPLPANPTHCPPLLAQRIEYTRLFEDGRCLPGPPVGLGRQRAVRLYAEAVREDETSFSANASSRTFRFARDLP